MSDIDRVFARLGGGQSAANEQREQRRIPRKGGAPGSRVVEVVRLAPSGGTARAAQRPDVHLRAQSWEDGFPAQPPRPSAAPAGPPAAEAPAPTVHVMPMWERSSPEPATARDEPRKGPARRKAETPVRRVADPFDPEDDGANCLRCGYAIEPVREARGLMTCAACG
jgi:hypothetical protein